MSMTDGDWTTRDLQATAANASNGVCSLCEEYLSDRPVEPGLPYHVDCFKEAMSA